MFLLSAPAFPFVVRAENITSPLNGKVLNLSETPKDYSFLISGHVYGAHSPSVYPAASFLGSINKFNDMDAQFFVMLGDIIQNFNEVEISTFEYTISNNLDLPIFNAVGNHDVSNRSLYEEHFGRTYFTFKHGSELYIILDSELNKGQIEGQQLEFLLNVLNETKHSDDIKNIFIFSHRLIWAIDNKPIDEIIPYVNGGPGSLPKNATSFKDYVLPELITLSDDKNIYLISGDVGCEWSFPLFYEKDKKHNITYVACGIGESKKDAIIKVDITKGGEVTFSPISLSGEKLEEMDYYGVDFWTTYFSEQEKRIQKVSMDIHSFFGINLISAIIGGLSAIILLKKIRKRKKR